MAVAVALPQSLERLGDRVFMISGAVLITAALCFCSIALSALGLGAVWLLLGAGTSLIQTPAGRLLARSSNANTRTAVYAAQFSLSHACWLITYPVAGWVGAAVSLEVASLTLASIAAGACLLALAVWPANDPTALEHTHPTTTHTHPHQHDQHHPHAHRPAKVAKNHEHEHTHAPITHTHPFVIDEHHSVWPATNRLS